VSAATYLSRMRANAAQALAEGATVADVVAEVLTVTRKVSRPGQAEAEDAAEVTELVEVLNEYRGTGGGDQS
jgi:hypothetical protein